MTKGSLQQHGFQYEEQIELSMEDDSFFYVGDELKLFSEARNWRSYWTRVIEPYLGESVLEVGAGVGSVTRLLSPHHVNWTALEPDNNLAKRIEEEVVDSSVEVVVGSIDAMVDAPVFDSILYADVLEHIEQDALEVRKAARRLRSGGFLIVLSPAHSWLFSHFDARVGHFRRYSIDSLVSLAPPNSTLQTCFYLDSVGLLASLANRFLLRTGAPTRRQIAVWDKSMIPVSRFLDRLIRHRLGKSVVVVWRIE